MRVSENSHESIEMTYMNQHMLGEGSLCRENYITFNALQFRPIRVAFLMLRQRIIVDEFYTTVFASQSMYGLTVQMNLKIDWNRNSNFQLKVN